MKRAVHEFEFASGIRLFLRWHRYTEGNEQFPGGYTAEAQIYEDQLERGSLMAEEYLRCMSFLKSSALDIVKDHEEHTWADLGVTGALLTRVYAVIPTGRYKLQYAVDNPPSVEIRWQRLKAGIPLPSYCDGVLLYSFAHDEQGLPFAKININKGEIRSTDLQARLVAMLQACLPLAEMLDEEHGLRGDLNVRRK